MTLVYFDKKFNHKNRMAVRDWLKGRLMAEQENRTENPNDWDRLECQELLDCVNWGRAQLDKDPITMRMLVRAQAQAVGHIDYTSKFALYCMELIFDDRPR